MKYSLSRMPTFLALSLVGLLAVAPTDGLGGKKKDSPTVVEDALAFAASDRSRAIQMLESAISDSPNARDVGLLMVHAGEQRRLAGNAQEAQKWFNKVVQRGQPGPDLSSAKLGLGLLEASRALDARVMNILQQVEEREALATQNADRYLMLAVEAARRSDDRMVSAYSKKALAYAREDRSVLERVEATLKTLAKDPKNAEVSAPIAGGNAFERAETAYLEGNFEAALREAQKAASQETGENQERAKGLIRVLESGPADRNVIAVLLPLSGKYEAAGKQYQEALQYGYGSGSRRLIFVDTGSTPETAVVALEDSVLNKHAIAVVGPALSEETDLVVEAAERLHVPLLTLSQSYEPADDNVWTLQGMPTRADQLEALLSFTMGDRQMKSFAIFANDNPVTQETVALFKEMVAEKGGSISTEASYPAGEKNLLEYAKKLGNREGDINVIRKQIEAAGGNPNSAVLPPKIDFNAIFIPENAGNTPLACAALAYEEFPMGDFTPRKGMEKIPVIGLKEWNNPNLIATGNEYIRGSLFPDVFSASVVGDTDPFVTAFRDATGRTPSSTEAALVDLGKLLAAAAGSNASTRSEFRQALLNAKLTDSLTGMTHIDPETLLADRTMKIYTITRTKIEQVATVELR